jgi:cytochrome b pre-mRNA-processing protein 3
MLFAHWFRPSPAHNGARLLYGQLVDQARAPMFYAAYGVPDSLDGRYEMLALHAFMVLRRLKRDDGPAGRLAQALFDAMFADMDRSLREIGVSDLAVGKRVKEMARGLYGRIAAYEGGLADGVTPAGDALAGALARNVYGTVAPPPAAALVALARYVRLALEGINGLPSDRLGTEAPLPWPPIPALELHPAST